MGKDQKWNPPDWVKQVHGHEMFVTLDRATEVEGPTGQQAFENRHERS